MSEERGGKPSIPDRLRDFWQNTKRIVRVARRPTFQEVRLIARVSGIGILLVGAVAYLLQILGSFTNEFFVGKSALIDICLHLAVNIAPVFVQVCMNPTLILVAAGISLIAVSDRK
ncbi:MAG: preprotein translocase subunit SecE [Candidatus Lokiarchaeota archaeon]|nr:preprotein translocase subunit SecE [Candidatus Lokiarchaeota archaeon]